MNKVVLSIAGIFLLLILGVGARFLITEEGQNRISRSIQNFIGAKYGKVVVYQNGSPVFSAYNVEKLSTAYGTDDGAPRNYRYGYGHIDLNNDGKLDIKEKEKKRYFEIPNFATYVYFDAKE